jgi:integrase
MAKRIPPLTDRQVMNAKPLDKMYRLFDGGGLYLEVASSGSRLWKFKYRRPGANDETRMSFGTYPQVSLADARRQRTEARLQLSAGVDPAQARRDAAASIAEEHSLRFEKVARAWHATMLSGWQPDTAANILHRLEQDIFPSIGATHIAAIKPRDILAAIQAIEHRGAKEIARRNLANVVRIFDFAINRGDTERINPAARLGDVLQPAEKGHYASITPDDLPKFVHTLAANGACMGPVVRAGMIVMLLSFVRTAELIETPWLELQGPLSNETDPWVIPWQRMKMGRRRLTPDKTDHYVPMAWQMRKQLRMLETITGGGLLLFPNQRDASRPLSNNTFLKALERMGYKGDMTGHGFRSLAMSTLKEKLRYRHEVVDRQLAHKQMDKQDSAYDRARYLEERKEMLQEWADYVCSFGLVI